ncbi:MAG: winged helix-turn-helix domain-containing protein, partial [Methanomicrobiales archaeon]|nr:winged helix-turn-helix domain-containing protein [Methanomicrobiales archaeon]
MQHEPETAARILKALKYRSRGMTIADIAKTTGISRNTAARQLELLRVNGQVELKAFGSAKVY